MGDVLIAIVAAALIVIAIVASRIVSWLGRRHTRARDDFQYLCDSYGFEKLSDRFAFDTRIIRYAGHFRGAPAKIEVGMGGGVSYARVDFAFEREVPLGLHISSEHEEGLLTRVMRLREVKIGLHHFDSQFILLSRNEGRLKQLLDHDVRRMLISLRKAAKDVKLNDEGLHLFVAGAIERAAFVALLEEGAQLSSHVFRRGEDILTDEAKASEEAPAPAFTPIPGALQAVKSDEERP